MQSSLLNQLSKVVSFSTQLISILEKIKKSLVLKWNPSFLKQMEHHIVSLTCQNKNLLHYKYLQDKNNNEKCLTLILQILQTLININKQSRSHIVSLFMSHIYSHTSCYISYSTFYLLILSHPELLDEISHEKLTGINKKLEKQQNQNQLKQLNITKVTDQQVFTPKQLQLCEENLNLYLSSVIKPTMDKSQKHHETNLAFSKIPPLILPTSKSINSSRYSAISKQDKRKGLADMRKLAINLGESFISVELGCLLSNKRTQQVQEFSENYSFRQKCLEKLDQIETERMNSSRLSFQKDYFQKQPEFEQNSKRYYRKVITVNFNIIMKKLSIENENSRREKQNENLQQYIKQIIDMSLLGIIQLSPTKYEIKPYTANDDANIFACLRKQSKEIDEIIEEMMKKVAEQSEKIHLNLLMNKNKSESLYHFSTNFEEILINDSFLNDATIVKLQPEQIKGNFKIDDKGLIDIKRTADDVILYVGKWLQSLFRSANIDHPKFIAYEVNLLKVLNFYLTIAQSKVTPYLIIEMAFPLLMLIKRQLIQLSHPFIQNPESTNRSKITQIPLIFRNRTLMQNYLDILTNLLVSNKYVQKLISNVFLKNIYFMELIEHYLEAMFEEEHNAEVVSVLRFYKKVLEVFQQRKNKNNDAIIRNIMQQICAFLCPSSGVIARALCKYESMLSPSFLEDQPRTQSINPTFHFLHEVFMFVSYVYYQACPENLENYPILDEDIASFYIKYAFMNYIKLYSLMTVKELVNLNSGNEDIMTTKQSPHLTPKISSKKVFMIDFLKILTSISINRTNAISKRFLQYRVLQFFVRELELEFCVSENIEKYIKKIVQIKDVPLSNQKIKTMPEKLQPSEGSSKKPKVTALNLTGEIFKKQQGNKKFNNTHQPKGKKLVPPLNIPVKTQQREKSISKDRSSGDRGKKDYLDDLLDEITDKGKEKKKKSFVGELNLQLSQLKSKEQASKRKDSSEKQLIYSTQRKIRKIYSNKLLHSESILLVFSLLLMRGQLDPMYCDQFPIDEGKMNVLYILHYHLNHSSNKSIIPLLSESVTKIKPYLSGQRLLKLLYNSFTDLRYYENWSKISTGGYGVIYSATTQLYEPKQVAIKEMNFPKSISNRCVLHNIFTQISALELFRLDHSVTRMYNYGVIDNTYFIIMKKYTCSLRDWRLGHKISPLMDAYPVNLPNILSLYYDILKVVKLLHEQNVIHYDIKADNIMLEIIPPENGWDKPFIRVAFGDFGEAKIFINQQDELDLKSRGTECIKSPEMLTLALKNKKQADHYDRRKKIGTTKASDIWSLGCLLYEMVTGEYMFHRNQWANFYMQVTSPTQEILSPDNYEKMNNNIYLIDFLKYILIRDPSHRPSIQNIINRFQNLYSLLVNNEPKISQQNFIASNCKNPQILIKEYMQLINQPIKPSLKSMEIEKSMPKMLKIMEDIYFCDSVKLIRMEKLKQENITHVICTQKVPQFRNLRVFLINFNDESPENMIYRLCPRVSDFLREVLLFKGKLLFVNNQTNFAINLLIFTLSYWFRCSAYETWCLINTQLLSFPSFTFDLLKMSKALEKLNSIEKQFEHFPKLQCICGSVTIIMKKCPEKKSDYQVCKCKKKSQISHCSSTGCAKYVQFLKRRYNISWDHLKWALVPSSLLLTSSFKSRNQQENTRTQILLNSAEPSTNMIGMEVEANGWVLYECKMCEMWIMAVRNGEMRIILNNLIKTVRQGIMIPNAQQGFKARTPALNYYTLSKLHMTSQ